MSSDRESSGDLPIWEYRCHGVTARWALSGVMDLLRDFQTVGVVPDVVAVSVGKTPPEELDANNLRWAATLLLRGEKRWPDAVIEMYEREIQGEEA